MGHKQNESSIQTFSCHHSAFDLLRWDSHLTGIHSLLDHFGKTPSNSHLYWRDIVFGCWNAVLFFIFCPLGQIPLLQTELE